MAPEAVRQAPRAAQAAFCPTDASHLATGTMAGAIDLSFSSAAAVEIWSLELAKKRADMELAGQAVSTWERFHRLAWGRAGPTPIGTLAGGLADGTIGVWDPKVVLDTKPSENADESGKALLAQLQHHRGSVRGLQFNPCTTNLLASGSADAEICIWDLATPKKPSLYPALKNGSANENAPGETTFLQWNNKVQHILASTSTSGTTVVWDLKRQKPVISFTDPNGKRRCSALQWNPEVATQLIVASDDDRAPSLQVWDLRNSISPVREFVGHQKGVLSLAWCPHDPSLLLSCGKDNRVICWGSANGDILCELASESNWYFDVQWSPTLPGIFSASSFDGKVELYNVMDLQAPGEGLAGGGAGGAMTGMKTPPSWMRKPSAVSFGFGGKVVSVANTYGESGKLQAAPSVSLRTVTTDSDLVDRSVQFEEAIKGADKATLLSFCDVKAAAGADEEEQETWTFMKNLFAEDARKGLLGVLGFEPAPVRDTSEEEVAAQLDSATISEGAEIGAPVSPVEEGDPDSFFDNLPSPVAKSQPKPAAPKLESTPEAIIPEKRSSDGSDEKLNQAIMVGDFEGAVATCLASGRLADALIIAPLGGEELAFSTKKECMRRSPRPYMSVLKALMDSELEGLVQTRPVEGWRETLAMLCTYAKGEKWTGLCDALAQRLWAANLCHAATLCSICSGNVDDTVTSWCSKLPSNFRENMDLVQDLIEKSVVLGMASSQEGACSRLSGLVAAYGEILASQGHAKVALDYLNMLPGNFGPESEIGILKDRIYRSGQLEASAPSEGGNQQPQGVAPAAPQVPPAAAQTVPTTSAPHAGQYAPTGGYQPPAYQAQPAYQPQQNYQPASYNPAYQQPTQAYGTQQQVYQPPATAYSPQMAYHQEQPSAAPGQPSYGGAPQPQAYQPQQPAPAAPPSMPSQAPSMFVPTAPAVEKTPAPVHPTSQFVPTASQVAPPAQAAMHPTNVSPATTPRSPAAPSKPTGPPKGLTLETVDTGSVPQEMQGVVRSLSALYRNCSAVTASNPIKKREMEDNSKRLAVLFYSLNSGDVSNKVCAKLRDLCHALDSGDFAAASHIQVGMTTSDWDECSAWLTALKRLIKTGSSLR
eukprot:scaffold626_cov337-Pavlova_lutheri.AAC.17